ncbi:hypothetical protein AXF23_00020 [Prevotella sp. oral taxon 313]|nr:hypothetical protein AXF23_00020 [Prevotella sp. oral taxon 313]
MQKEWQKIRKDGKFIIDDQTYYLEKIDEVFLLSDVDNFYAKLQVILSSKSNDDTGRWIISNPALEIWLYYCYKNDPNNDLNCITSLSSQSTKQILKQRCNDVVKGGLNGLGLRVYEQWYKKQQRTLTLRMLMAFLFSLLHKCTKWRSA